MEAKSEKREHEIESVIKHKLNNIKKKASGHNSSNTSTLTSRHSVQSGINEYLGNTASSDDSNSVQTLTIDKLRSTSPSLTNKKHLSTSSIKSHKPHRTHHLSMTRSLVFALTRMAYLIQKQHQVVKLVELSRVFYRIKYFSRHDLEYKHTENTLISPTIDSEKFTNPEDVLLSNKKVKSNPDAKRNNQKKVYLEVFSENESLREKNDRLLKIITDYKSKRLQFIVKKYLSRISLNSLRVHFYEWSNITKTESKSFTSNYEAMKLELSLKQVEFVKKDKSKVERECQGLRKQLLVTRLFFEWKVFNLSNLLTIEKKERKEERASLLQSIRSLKLLVHELNDQQYKLQHANGKRINSLNSVLEDVKECLMKRNDVI